MIANISSINIESYQTIMSGHSTLIHSVQACEESRCYSSLCHSAPSTHPPFTFFRPVAIQMKMNPTRFSAADWNPIWKMGNENRERNHAPWANSTSSMIRWLNFLFLHCIFQLFHQRGWSSAPLPGLLGWLLVDSSRLAVLLRHSSRADVYSLISAAASQVLPPTSTTLLFLPSPTPSPSSPTSLF